MHSSLAGTRIAMDLGDVTVEQFPQGDGMVILKGSEPLPGRVLCSDGSGTGFPSLDEAVACASAPVRILAHAFAANVPARDLMVSPEHEILVDGSLIPARMLVNGASIVQERGLRDHDVHHVDAVTHLDAMALPAASHAVVEPIRRRLLARARQLGLVAPATPAAADTHAPALRLRLDDGTVVRARSRTGERHFFVMPAGNERAILLARSASPARAGPAIDDGRPLGMLVHSATLWMEQSDTAIPLAASWLQGRHTPSFPGQLDGIDGEAEITFDAVSQTTVLEVTLASA